MIIRKIKPNDIFEIEKWYEDRATIPPEPYDYPEVGFIAEGIAAIFVYQTDASFVVTEGLISNKYASLADRKAAIDSLYLEVIKFSREYQYTKILAITEHSSVVKFLEDEDFLPLRHSVFIKELL